MRSYQDQQLIEMEYKRPFTHWIIWSLALLPEYYAVSEKDSTISVEMEIEWGKLRRCWELASVLNFFSVSEPVIQSRLKASAEEIESALILPNDLLAQLHIALLKAYTVEEIVAGKANLADSVVGASSFVQLADVRIATSIGDRQIFSPTTKNVLTKIDDALDREKTSYAQGSVVKTALALGEASSKPVPAVSSFQSEFTTEVLDDPTLLSENPTKKVKN